MRSALLLVLSFLTTVLCAQIESYNFQDFRQANTSFRSLEIRPYLNGNHNFQKIDDYKSNLQQVNSQINFTHFKVHNSENRKTNNTLSGDIRPSYSSTKNGDLNKTNKGSILVDANYILDTKKFTNYDQYFTGWYGDAGGNFRYSSEKEIQNVAETTIKITNSTMNLNGGFQFGLGRIENISNAWHALRIANRLLFTEITDNDLNHQQLNAFGQEIDRIKAQRVYDNRLGYQAQMMMLDAYVQDEITTKRNDLKYFLELNDMWSYGISENRIMGHEWDFRLGLVSELFRLDEKTSSIGFEEETLFRRTRYGPQASIHYTNGRPINQFSQFNFNGEISYKYQLVNLSRDNSKTEFNNSIANTSIGLLYGFYPTTRTEYTASFNASVNFDNLENQENKQFFNNKEYNMSLGLNGVYWLNWRSTLTYGINAIWANREEDLDINFFDSKEDYFYFRYGVSFRHAIY